MNESRPNQDISLIEVALFLSDAYEPEYFKEIVEKMRDMPTWQSFTLVEPTEGYILSACVLCEHNFPADLQEGPVVELRYLASLEDKHLLDLVNKLKQRYTFMVTLGSQESTKLMLEMGFHKVDPTERIKVRLEKLLYGSALSSTKSPLFVYRNDKESLVLQIQALQSKL